MSVLVRTPDRSQIEEWVRSRDLKAATRAIRKYLFGHRGEKASYAEASIEACEWYRRLGLFPEALGVLNLGARNEGRRLLERTQDATSRDGRRLLHAARILNVLGAWEFSLRILKCLEISRPDDHRVAAVIYLASFEVEKALHHFDQYFLKNRNPDPNDYHLQFARVGRADALASLGRYSEANLQLEKVDLGAGPAILAAIVASVRGEFCVRQGAYQEGLRWLGNAESQMPAGETGVDRAVLEKWKAVALAQTGALEEAREFFSRAFERLWKLGVRQEAMLDVCRLRADHLPMSSEEKDRFRFQIRSYPGSCPGFRKILPLVQAPAMAKPSKTEITVYPERDEYHTKSRLHLGIPLELSCLTYLSATGDWGMQVRRMKALLWPEEPFAWDELDSRLTTLLTRIRKRFPNINLTQTEGRIHLQAPPHWLKIEDAPDGVSWPRFLEQDGEFTSGDVSNTYFRMGKSRAAEVLKIWIARSWVKPVGIGRARRYRSLVAQTRVT